MSIAALVCILQSVVVKDERIAASENERLAKST
jgi:hypothetical protein